MKELKDRFLSHVIKTDGCWLWTAYRMKNGYGTIRMPDRHHLAHRVSHELFNGPIPDGMDVLHSCDNPACVNPAHLSFGTKTDNMRDAKSKGRTAKGQRHGRSKLTESQAREVFFSDEPQKELARRFGVAQPTISDIKTGRKWSHIQSTDA